jgi:dTDP-4-dehydrorhamnose 3,5-epimerase
VHVVRGSIYDVTVDLRAGSPTYGRWMAVTLTAESGRQLFVPCGCARGYCTLEPDIEVAYKVDEYYAPELEQGVMWNDPALVPTGNPIRLISRDESVDARWRWAVCAN